MWAVASPIASRGISLSLKRSRNPRDSARDLGVAARPGHGRRLYIRSRIFVRQCWPARAPATVTAGTRRSSRSKRSRSRPHAPRRCAVGAAARASANWRSQSFAHQIFLARLARERRTPRHRTYQPQPIPIHRRRVSYAQEHRNGALAGRCFRRSNELSGLGPASGEVDLSRGRGIPAGVVLLSYIPAAPSSRLAIRAPRPRSSTDFAIRGPLLTVECGEQWTNQASSSVRPRARTCHV